VESISGSFLAFRLRKLRQTDGEREKTKERKKKVFLRQRERNKRTWRPSLRVLVLLDVINSIFNLVCTTRSPEKTLEADSMYPKLNGASNQMELRSSRHPRRLLSLCSQFFFLFYMFSSTTLNLRSFISFRFLRLVPLFSFIN
jgi:hypothetical protein